MLDQPAFGGMLHQLVSLGVIEFRPAPQGRLAASTVSQLWRARRPEFREFPPRIWFGNCRHIATYTLSTPFYNSEITGGEFLIAFVLYADTLLSINQIAPLLDHAYNTVYEGIRRMEAALDRGFPTVWDRISHTIDDPTQVDETQQVCSGNKGQDPPREGLSRGGSSEGGRTRWSGKQGDELTFVAACRDVLRVVSAEEGSKYEENLGPVIEEVGNLSQPLGEVCTDELPA